MSGYHVDRGASPHSRYLVFFFFGSPIFQLGCRVAAASAQRPVEHVKNAQQNITTEWTPHSVSAGRLSACHKSASILNFHSDRRAAAARREPPLPLQTRAGFLKALRNCFERRCGLKRKPNFFRAWAICWKLNSLGTLVQLPRAYLSHANFPPPLKHR